jgi:hypothetical protein
MNKEKLKGYTSIYWSIDNIANLLGGLYNSPRALIELWHSGDLCLSPLQVICHTGSAHGRSARFDLVVMPK